MSWEQSVLGTAIYSPEMVDLAIELRPADFTGTHQEIWEQVLSLHRREVLEPRTLIEALRTNNTLSDIGTEFSTQRGEEYIRELASFRGEAMPEYVDQVIAASVRRELRSIGALVMAEARDSGVSVDEVMDNAEARMFALRRGRTVNEGTAFGDIIGAFIPRMDAYIAGTLQPAWVPSVRAMKDMIRYAEDTDYMVIAGRPGDGKSSYMRYEFNMAALRGTPVLIFNLENNETEYARAALAMTTGIDSEKLKEPTRMTDTELGLVRAAAERVASMPIYISSIGGPSLRDVQRISRHHVTKDAVGLIGVDYIQLMNNNGADENANITVSSQGLRAMALNMHVPIIAAAQLNRSIETRGTGSRPRLSDLRGSGSLEQDPTHVIFPRNMWEDPSPDQLRRFPENVRSNGQLHYSVKAVPITFHVVKNRNGGTGESTPVKFIKATNQYITLEI